METTRKHEKIKLVEINSYLTCYLCKGYLIDATTISECLHSFCRSCIIKFLQENCYCPVCEVIINKAKPCLKLDKTLQDIVYKLVPELFINEMVRRKQFYQKHPELLQKTTPEERGEDTERTIFNPQDAISLSIEYISDDSSPGAITVPSMMKKLKNEDNHINNNNNNNSNNSDNPMKRYLQCPGMCRIEVLKKFVQNKYNVDTNLFHIDVLYKRVPLPDHYTLIDIGYIYSWKRNEPMKFFFRITDINKLSERFDYFDAKTTTTTTTTTPEIPLTTITTTTTKITTTTKSASVRVKNSEKSRVHKENLKRIETIHRQQQQQQKVDKTVINDDKKKVKSEIIKSVTSVPILLDNNCVVTSEKSKTKLISDKKEEKSINECGHQQNEKEIKNDRKILKNSSVDSSKNGGISVNITSNSEIAKVEKNQVGHATENNTTRNNNNNNSNSNKVQTNTVPNNSNNQDNGGDKRVDKGCEIIKKLEQERDEDVEKSNFLKSIELTARTTTAMLIKPTKTTSTIAATLPTTTTKSTTLINRSPTIITTTTTPIVTTTTTTTSAQKRKNSSPMKNDKKQKTISSTTTTTTPKQAPMKILIQSKSIQNPTIRQIVSNVNQNVTNLTKIVEKTTPNCSATTTPITTTTTTTTTTDLRSIIDNCKLNIPSSLSITLNEGENNSRTPPSILPPVKNYIEILKLPDNSGGGGGGNGDNKNQKIESPTSDQNKTTPTKDNGVSFQKIFEESIKKRPDTTPNSSKSDKTTPLDLTNNESTATNNNNNNSNNPPNSGVGGAKRKILEIASQLSKKSKLEMEKQKNAAPLSPQTTTPTTTTTTTTTISTPLTTATMHSASLGLKYTVSIDKNVMNEMRKTVLSPKLLSPPPLRNPPQYQNRVKAKSLSPNNQHFNNNNNNNNTTVIPTKTTTTHPHNNSVVNTKLNNQLLLEKYNLQNLAQLTASFTNFNPACFVATTTTTTTTGSGGGGPGVTTPNNNNNNNSGSNNNNNNNNNTANIQALQHAMLLKHIEQQQQNWLNLNQAPLLQYEKYLQSLSQNQKKIVANLKDN